MIHEILLKKYGAAWADGAGTASLGTADSYGLEQLRVTPGEGWEGLTITATFHPPSGDPVRVLVPEDGLLDVPWEATASTGRSCRGKIVFAGVADGVQRISCDLIYTVKLHAPVEGNESSATPELLDQVLAEVQAVREAVAGELSLAIEEAVEEYFEKNPPAGTSDITINGQTADEGGNFIINTVSDTEIAQLSAALT